MNSNELMSESEKNIPCKVWLELSKTEYLSFVLQCMWRNLEGNEEGLKQIQFL